MSHPPQRTRVLCVIAGRQTRSSLCSPDVARMSMMGLQWSWCPLDLTTPQVNSLVQSGNVWRLDVSFVVQLLSIMRW